jgi:hypothetical protein
MSCKTHYDRYKELCDTYKIKIGTFDLVDEELAEDMSLVEKEMAKHEAMQQYDVVIEHAGYGYAHKRYKVLRNTPRLNTEDLAIICDRGNLCFGYRVEGSIICVYTD